MLSADMDNVGAEEEEEPASESADSEDVEAEAIIKMQSAFRGHKVRGQQTEEARLQWLQYHLQTGEYEEARKLCVSEEETQMASPHPDAGP